jgi:hypothetical protein
MAQANILTSRLILQKTIILKDSVAMSTFFKFPNFQGKRRKNYSDLEVHASRPRGMPLHQKIPSFTSAIDAV